MKEEIDKNGFAIIESMYSKQKVKLILACIEEAESKNESFLKTKNLFAIRQLLKNIPNLAPLLFSDNLKAFLSEIGSQDYFLTKALYFDKPRLSNWFVPYHQDISISVKEKHDVQGYKNWTFKKGQYGVQPPVKILENTITGRVHLDDADENNGALKVIPQSHLQSIIKEKPILINEITCTIASGGVMLMKPLLLHASSRSTNNKKRRVIHLEFCDRQLASSLEWLEYHKLFEDE